MQNASIIDKQIKTKELCCFPLLYIWNLMNIISLVKLHYFQLAFVENCVYKKQKRSTKHQWNFCSNTF